MFAFPFISPEACTVTNDPWGKRKAGETMLSCLYMDIINAKL
jgi:hypothetical protein